MVSRKKNELGKYIHKYSLTTNLGFNKITSELFKEPMQYGLRGDLYLWKDLKVRFEYSDVTKLEEFREFLMATFEKNIGHKPLAGKNFNVKHFRFGGISSGGVSSDFWIDKGFPLLLERYQKLNNNNK